MFTRIFLSHPRSVDETYVQHAVFASRFAAQLALAAGAAAVHALVPSLFEKTASQMIARMHATIQDRGGSGGDVSVPAVVECNDHIQNDCTQQ
ncbi:DUF6356 family protein [Tateyamaria sp. syn59]|uniref:DUF6356 family protein n=1 Tax=Tateyamaria sp. syn59 TaxID=2576942 RepID=UPI00351A4B4B